MIASADTSNTAAAATYQTGAEQRIMEILAEHAAVRRELESRIAEGYWPSSGLNINPRRASAHGIRYRRNSDELTATMKLKRCEIKSRPGEGPLTVRYPVRFAVRNQGRAPSGQVGKSNSSSVIDRMNSCGTGPIRPCAASACNRETA